ncbi:aminotransferase-like domain-containing protein [Anaeromicrobium sediminis]|uniref:GntR family transcriptional regulator n=1 Tax=Anaeromicrobium sediminis TaxID=1478221 RepID=A0A267MKR1_9FIRM|nr:PLP-dependent aminotransferase family protein [Anaeromicrobium sediminis]PAB60007.1 GntR family transcriptional regulator [Anaeromicrobium sediminis]
MISIHWKPDKNSIVPLRRQIINYFTDKISKGQWPIGSIIPPQRDLARLFNVNRSTIVAALSELKSQGLIEGNGKSGTKIISSSILDLTKSQPDWQTYMREGIQIPNYKTIKTINDIEWDDKIIRLSSGEPSPELFPDGNMKKIVNKVSIDMNNLGYECPHGMYHLREEISKYLKAQNIDAAPSSILIVSGALQAIHLISIGLLQPGSSVFIEKPSYMYSLQILQTLGMRRLGIPMDHEGIMAKEIPKYVKKHRSSILYTIPNFQNPTGNVMSQERRKELIKICKEEKLPIIEDDVYRELWIDNPPPDSLKSLDKSGNVLYIGSMSKALSPGLRIGWIVGPDSVISHLADIKMQMDYGSSSLSQLTVAKWLSTGLYEEQVDFLRKELRIRRDIALNALNKYFSNMATWHIPQGGYYVWVKLKGKINMHKLFEEGCKSGVLLYPGYVYESNSNTNIRISYSYASHEDIEKGLHILSNIVQRLLHD